MWNDYDLDNPGSWEVMPPPEMDREWEQQLTRIGGLNPFGQPNLVWRWGATYVDPMKESGDLKYLVAKKEPELRGFEFTDPVTGMTLFVETEKEVPPSIVAVPKYEAVQLGERKIIIERWRSAEFLARCGRYRANMLRDPDKTYQWFFCKACNAVLTVGDDGPRPCPQCGSKRSYLRELRIDGEGKLLRSFPHEGCYDFFVRLENEHDEPLPPDRAALNMIEAVWHNDHHMTDQQRDKLVDRILEPQIALAREANNPANPFRPPI
jgi:hypothetical protein